MTIEKKEYKQTVNLPKTDFPMRAGLPEFEPKKLKEWEADGLYARIRAKSNGKLKYILHDGPPYANGNIHIGHALNKILKDIIVKFKTMSGLDAHYVPGWDCHGMPIEHAIFKEMGKRKEDVNQPDFRKKAREYAEKYVHIQREEFKRLGIFGDWNAPYLTMTPGYQAAIAESFLALCEKGMIYQGLKPVPWCYDCETALADAELEYEDKTSPSVYVAFEILNSTQPANLKVMSLAKGKPAFVIVWTTTPWTLPANVAMAFHPDLSYSIFEVGGKVFIAAEDLVSALESKFGLKGVTHLQLVHGRDLKGLHARRPFSPEPSVGVLAGYVSATDGTGIVHIAPGHGEEDYGVGLDNQLPILSPVDHKGRFTSEFKEAEGVHVAKANKKIIELLREKQTLLFTEDHEHSYPHCWRCKNPVIFRATKQWFLKVSDEFRAKLIHEVGRVQFFPEWGKNRIGSMLATRPDWCLSRQRLWGVPIPIVSCATCEKTFAKEAKPLIVEKFKKSSSDVWFSEDAKSFLPAGFKCPCGSSDFKQETDIIDVWFDSGVSHQAVLKNTEQFPDLKYPADLYLEGSDQHRGWFQSSLIASTALEGHAPFKSILTHGFVVDGEGKKMSKSAKNVVAPQDVMKQYGADILRLWVASCDYSQDVRLSKEILERIADAYRKIRNTFRYLLANLYDFNPEQDAVKPEKMDPVDQYILEKSKSCFVRMVRGYEEFNFLDCFQFAYELCNEHLSSFYLDAAKDRLYTAAAKSEYRRSAQTAIWTILKEALRLLAPIMPFTCDQAWGMLPAELKPKSVHEDIHEVEDGLKMSRYEYDKAHTQILNDWDELVLKAREDVLRELEDKRAKGEIAASLEAHVTLRMKEKQDFDRLKKFNNLRFYYIVSQLSLSHTPNQQERFVVEVAKADGTKCVRCWNYSTRVGESAEHPDLCERCVTAV